MKGNSIEKLLMKNETVTNCHHLKIQVYKNIVKEKYIFKILTLLLILHISTTLIAKENEMDLQISYSIHADLVFHVLAHMRVNNASNLHCEEYIETMSSKRGGFDFDLVSQLREIEEYYNNNFGRLAIINFMPYFVPNFDVYKGALQSFQGFTPDDRMHFITPFIEILDRESVFFFDFWDKLHEANAPLRTMMEERLREELLKYSRIFDYFNKPPIAFLSYTMTRNGRGMMQESNFKAAVKFPRDMDDFYNTFFTLLHEYTHAFTDRLVGEQITMTNDTHELSEMLVLLADYYLVKGIDYERLPLYKKKFFGNEYITEEQIIETLKIEKDLVMVLRELIDNILRNVEE